MQPMRDILASSLARSLRETPDEDRLALAWPAACGSALAAHGEITHLDADGWLHVTVADPAWLQPFLRAQGQLTAALARIAGVRLAGIHFNQSPSYRGERTSR
jgi:hypothetical protein